MIDDERQRAPEGSCSVRLSRGKILPLMVALAAACAAPPVFARNDGTSPNEPDDNGIYWHGVGGVGIGALGWTVSRCLELPWYVAVPGTLGSALAVGLLREVAQHDWHLTRHQLAEGLSWGAGSAIGLGAGFTFEWGTGKRPCAGEDPRLVRTNRPREPFGRETWQELGAAAGRPVFTFAPPPRRR